MRCWSTAALRTGTRSKQMLDVLDSVDIPESLTTPRPKMIPVKNLPATTILSSVGDGL